MKKVLLVLSAVVLIIVAGLLFNSKKEVRELEAVQENAALTDGSYNIDSRVSKVSWSAAKVAGASHSGSVGIKSGSLTIENSQLKDGNLILDMKNISVEKDIKSLIKHLNSKDFFDTENYPEAKMIITSITPTEKAGIYFASGDLTVKGKTAAINFPLSVVQEGSRILVKSNLKIDRTLWDIKYGSGKFFDNLGNNMIKDEIDLIVDLQAVR